MQRVALSTVGMTARRLRFGKFNYQELAITNIGELSGLGKGNRWQPKIGHYLYADTKPWYNTFVKIVSRKICEGGTTMGVLDSYKNDDNSLVDEDRPWLFFNELLNNPRYEYLRNIQTEFLKRWYVERDKKDVVGILSTGTGKTLIGLLVLKSLLIQKKGPALYLCPDNNLVSQVIQEASRHGISVVQLSRSSENARVELPLAFTSGEAILVTTFERLFNGLSIFGKPGAQPTEVGSILVDDAHSCVAKARSQATVVIDRQNDESNFQQVLTLFEKALDFQSHSKLLNIQSGDFSTAMRVPYWEVREHRNELSAIVKSANDEADGNKFSAPFVQENYKNLDVFISGNRIEITPINTPVEMIPSFTNAEHRIFLSATLTNASELISEMGVSKDAIKNSIHVNEDTDTGEKLVIVPMRFSEHITDAMMRNFIGDHIKNGLWNTNVVVIVPSTKATETWIDQGAQVFDKSNINDLNDFLSGSTGNIAVLANRYEGMDLEGHKSHMLVLDGLPQQSTVRDLAMNQENPNSTGARGKIIQEIEQGMGRTVRSGADHSTIILLGHDLQSFISIPKNAQLFSRDTQALLAFNKDLAKRTKKLTSTDGAEASADRLSEISELIGYSLNRDKDWQSTYKKEVKIQRDKIHDQEDGSVLDAAGAIREAWLFAKDEEYRQAADVLRTPKDLSSVDHAAMLQRSAQYLDQIDSVKARDVQKKAHHIQGTLLLSVVSEYSKVTAQRIDAGEAFKAFIANEKYENASQLAIYLESIIGRLVYRNSASEPEFRKAIEQLGQLIGAKSSQPEQDSNEGPDNLWRGINTDFIIEDKNRRTADTISRKDIEQLTNSARWYKLHYSGNTFIPLMFHPSSFLEAGAYADEGTRIVDKEKLELLCQALDRLSKGLQTKHPSDFTAKELQNLLAQNDLTENKFISKFTKTAKLKS